MTDRAVLQPTFQGLTLAKAAILAALGAFFWFLAAIFVHWIGPLGGLQGMARVIIYILIIPVTAPAIRLACRLVGWSPAGAQLAAAVMTGAALLLDGVAVGWFPSLYGPDAEAVRIGAASIMWGAGVAVMLGLIMSARAASRPHP